MQSPIWVIRLLYSVAVNLVRSAYEVRNTILNPLDRLAQIVFVATVQMQLKEMCDFELPARIGDDFGIEWPPLRRNARCDSFPHLSKLI